jgi:hypothetical protein
MNLLGPPCILISSDYFLGWLNKDFDPRAADVLIQAYTLGKIVDDIVDDQMDSKAWNALIGLIVDRTLA